jgi:hypothetical protein
MQAVRELRQQADRDVLRRDERERGDAERRERRGDAPARPLRARGWSRRSIVSAPSCSPAGTKPLRA